MYKLMPKTKMSWHYKDEPRSVMHKRTVRSARPVRGAESPVHAEAPIASANPRPCFVYILVHEREPRFKIGMSVDPLVRAGMLPDAPYLQWDTCLKAALPCRERAVEIERALHKGLSVFRVQVHGFDGESWDGGSEWFELRGLSHAVNLLSDMPISDESRELVKVTTIEGQPFLGLNPKAGFHKARELRAFEAAHENVRHMVEIVKVMRRINDDLDVIRHQPQKPKGQGRDLTGTDAATEVIYVAGLGDCWERHLLADRYRLSDSDFWMFNTGRVKRLNRKRTWMTRIAFDPQAKTTLVLTMQDRQVLQGLPGGLRMLQMWDQLWEE